LDLAWNTNEIIPAISWNCDESPIGDQCESRLTDNWSAGSRAQIEQLEDIKTDRLMTAVCQPYKSKPDSFVLNLPSLAEGSELSQCHFVKKKKK
jgi:hypothetical protein